MCRHTTQTLLPETALPLHGRSETLKTPAGTMYDSGSREASQAARQQRKHASLHQSRQLIYEQCKVVHSENILLDRYSSLSVSYMSWGSSDSGSSRRNIFSTPTTACMGYLDNQKLRTSWSTYLFRSLVSPRPPCECKSTIHQQSTRLIPSISDLSM